MHGLAVILFFIFNKGKFEHEKFIINNNNLSSTIVFMPLKKRVSQDEKNNRSQVVDQSRKVINYDVYQKALGQKNKKSVDKKIEKKSVKIPTQKNKPVVVKQAVKSINKTKVATTLHSEKNKKAVEVKKTEPVQVKKSLDEKKLSVTKEVEKQKVTSSEKVVKPVQDVNKEQNKKIVETSKQEEAINDIQSEKIENERVDVSQDDIIEHNIDVDDVSFVGRYDLEKYEIQERIKTEIYKYWKAPIGIAKTAVCELVIFVGSDGKVLRVVIQKGSGSLVYDISCRAAAYQSQFPKEFCGKEFIIELGA